ncbi:uncharacterized protein [Antedon mediterranea]|uniref:uncharacterized protein isoform X2 n=1 Tax=Antedon mediterranea TaxID=105859 RepID=UPI003AF9968F
MSETPSASVSNLLKQFNANPPVIGVRKPEVTPKPKPQPKLHPKPTENGRNNNHNENEVDPPSTTPKPTKLPPKPGSIRPKDFGIQPNIAQSITQVKLRRAPPPKEPIKTSTTPSEETEFSQALKKRNSKKTLNYDGGDKENKGLSSKSSVKNRSGSSSSTESNISNSSSLILAAGGKPQRAELPSIKECGFRPPKKAKPPLVRLPKATQAKPKPVIKPKPTRQVSLIQPTSDSDEEIQEDIYDDTETPAPPPLSNIPNYQSAPKIDQSSDFGETYDTVGDTGEDIYEAVDSSEIEARMPPGMNVSQEETQEDKTTEKQRKELEKQRKKEEEKKEKERLKKEREEKKRKEKEDKDNRKKFNIKGDIKVLREIVVTEPYAAKDKLDIGCYSGEQLELIREDNNPEDRYLVRNKQGVYGYVQIYCVDRNEPQELYDDVDIQIPEDFEEEVYDMCT